jgi:polyisoprenyl-teichoic acid--peptidoglycan teichoic acid transferase
MLVRKKESVNKRVYYAILVLFLIAGFFIYKKVSGYIRPIYELTFEKEIDLKQTEKKRINILLLGIGGGRHDGPLLTDTIIFASIDPEKMKMSLISVPRDLWIPEVHDKVNSVYSYGENNEKGSGLTKTKKVIGDIVGQRIDYGFRIDFDGFRKAIDMLGGIEVDVERTFDDYVYPLSGKENELCGWEEDAVASLSAQIATASATVDEYFPCRFEHLHFEQGLTQMDGDMALKFVRSRHAYGPEGSDFARSKRQEKVIRAVRNKVFSLGTLVNPAKLMGLFEIIKDSIDTDIKQAEYDDFIKLAQKMRDAEIYSVVLNMSDDENDKSALFYNPPIGEEFGYKWVIIPKAGTVDYSEIHSLVSCLIEKGEMCLNACIA